MEPTPTPALLTIAQVGERLQCSRTKVYDLMGSGQLQSVKVGALRRIPTQAVDAYLVRLMGEAVTVDAA